MANPNPKLGTFTRGVVVHGSMVLSRLADEDSLRIVPLSPSLIAAGITVY